MLYVDLPTRNEIIQLAKIRHRTCLSIYLPTTPLPEGIGAAQASLEHLSRKAEQELQKGNCDKRQSHRIMDTLQALQNDAAFWRLQAHSLCLFVTPDRLLTYRLPNQMQPIVLVSDRLHLKPMYRAIASAHSAFVLALSEQAVRLLEIHPNLPPRIVQVQGLPTPAISATGAAAMNVASHNSNATGTEGQCRQLQAYALAVDRAVRPLLAGRETPLILASTGRLAAIYAQVNSYPFLLEKGIATSPDCLTESELATAAHPILEAQYSQDLAKLRALFAQRDQQGRATTDIADAAHAATHGAIDTLMVDIDATVPGFVDDESGDVIFVGNDDNNAYDVVDEITARALASGARIFGTRKEYLPESKALAAILRCAP